jgi:type II secretory pathway pseudopilin PulG
MKKVFIKTEQQGGYVLIEILVSLLIFTIVAVTSATALLSIVDANAKSQTLKSVMDNLSVAVENMSRTMRIGTDIKCLDVASNTESQNSTQCASGTDGVTFLPQDATSINDRVQYYFKNGAIYRKYTTRLNMTTETALTAPEVSIDSVKFYVIAAGSTDASQARVYININGKAGVTQLSISPFNIQTSISQREIELLPQSP